MGLGPYTAPRAPDIAFVTAALGGLTALAAGGCVDLAHDKSEVMVRSGSVFEASVRPAGVLEPRWGERWGVIYASSCSLEGRTSVKAKSATFQSSYLSSIVEPSGLPGEF